MSDRPQKLENILNDEENIKEFPDYIVTERVVGTEELNSDLTCPICLTLLINPVDCIKCDTSFCNACIDNCKGNSITKNSCTICSSALEIKTGHKRVRNQLAQLKIRCVFYPRC